MQLNVNLGIQFKFVSLVKVVNCEFEISFFYGFYSLSHSLSIYIIKILVKNVVLHIDIKKLTTRFSKN